MEWWDKMMLPMRRVWMSFATRLGIRNSGLLKLTHDIRRCEYEDVQVMWEMLKKTETETAKFSNKKGKRPLWKIFMCPRLCHSF